MPNINLRLTEEEHRQLETWARDGRRSLQKEIIFRLFTDGGVATAAREHLDAQRIKESAARDIRLRNVEDPHFKPDFK